MPFLFWKLAHEVHLFADWLPNQTNGTHGRGDLRIVDLVHVVQVVVAVVVVHLFKGLHKPGLLFNVLAHVNLGNQVINGFCLLANNGLR